MENIKGKLTVGTKEYNEIADLIQSDTSPVGIDAKKTHIIIIEKLLALETELAEIKATLQQLKG